MGGMGVPVIMMRDQLLPTLRWDVTRTVLHPPCQGLTRYPSTAPPPPAV